MFFDTHAHYDDHQFDDDRDELLSSMNAGGVDYIINCGTTVENSMFSISLAEKYPFIYAATGIHPEEMEHYSDENLSKIESLLSHPKVVAVGEIGLDYHYGLETKTLQHEALRAQMELARKYNLPAIIHERDACMDTLNIVGDFKDVKTVFHCFSGSWETAKELLKDGRYLSFNGVITFKNARKAVEVVEKMPLERLMLETDCPYLAPVPNRGKRNSSLNLPFTAARIAEIRGISVEEVCEVTSHNAHEFFGI